MTKRSGLMRGFGGCTSSLIGVDRDEELQAMQVYGAEDPEELAMILDYLDKA